MTLRIIDPGEAMAEQARALKRYAARVMVDPECLSPDEVADREQRMGEFLAVGRSLQLTDKEMVDLIFGDLLRTKRECGCNSCRAKAMT